MICTPQALVDAAICYTKLSKEESDAAAIWSLCQWANSGPSPFPCGVPTNFILISGAGTNNANGLYALNTNHVGELWNNLNDLQGYVRGFAGNYFMEYGFAALQLYRTPASDFPCTWETDLDGINPPPTGQYVASPISWTPDTTIATWDDGIAIGRTGNLATFLATADFTTTVGIDFSAVNTLTTLVGVSYLPALISIVVSNNPISALDAHGLTSLSTLGAANCNFGTINLTGCVALTALDISGNPGVTIIGP